MHDGDKDFALDRSVLQDLGIAIFLVLFNKVLSVSTRKAKSKFVQDLVLTSFISNGKFIIFLYFLLFSR